MDKATLVDGVKRAGAFLEETARGAVFDHEDRAVQEAGEYELYRDLRRLVAALVDVSNDKEAIAGSLRRHWGIDQDEAERLVRQEMREHLPIRRLMDYLKSEKNYSPLEAREFIGSSRLPERLKNEPALSTMRPEQLYKELKKRP